MKLFGRKPLPTVSRIEILTLQSDDQIVLIYERRLNDDQAAKIRAQAEGKWPGHKITILDSNPQIKIIRGPA